MTDTHTKPYSERELWPGVIPMKMQILKKCLADYVPKLFRTAVALSPSLAVTSWQMGRAILCTGNLPRTLKEMIFTAVANAHDCHTVQLHIKLWH